MQAKSASAFVVLLVLQLCSQREHLTWKGRVAIFLGATHLREHCGVHRELPGSLCQLSLDSDYE